MLPVVPVFVSSSSRVRACDSIEIARETVSAWDNEPDIVVFDATGAALDVDALRTRGVAEPGASNVSCATILRRALNRDRYRIDDDIAWDDLVTKAARAFSEPPRQRRAPRRWHRLDLGRVGSLVLLAGFSLRLAEGTDRPGTIAYGVLLVGLALLVTHWIGRFKNRV